MKDFKCTNNTKSVLSLTVCLNACDMHDACIAFLACISFINLLLSASFL